MPCPGAPQGRHNTESDMLVLQYVYYRSLHFPLTLNQSQYWGIVRNSQLNIKQAKIINISSKQNLHVPGAGLSSRCCPLFPFSIPRARFGHLLLFHLCPRPHSMVQTPPPVPTTDLSTLFRSSFACSIALEISSTSLPAPAGHVMPSVSCTKGSRHRFRHMPGCTAGLKI